MATSRHATILGSFDPDHKGGRPVRSSLFDTVRRPFTSSKVRSIRLGAVGKIVVCSLLLLGLCDQNLASTPQNDQKSDQPLKRLSLEQLGNIKTTTASKEPVAATRT